MSTIETSNESILKLIKICFSRINYENTGFTSEKLSLKIDKAIERTTDECTVTIVTRVYAEDKSLNLEIEAKGFFDISECRDNEDVISKNTVAIMFPFIRSQVSLVTTQPDMAPIILPIINVNSLNESD